jgi:hypothetical protein
LPPMFATQFLKEPCANCTMIYRLAKESSG